MTNDEIKNVLQQKYSPNKVDTLIGKNLTSSIVSQQPKYLGSYSVESGNVLDMDRNRNLVSRYENYQGGYGNEDRLAKEQTWYGQLGNAVGKWAGKSFLNAADGITSYTYGIGKAIADGDISSMWNNDLTNFFDDQSKRLDRAMPILYTDEEKAQGALGKTFTWSYALDSISNGMAFITGAMLSEVPLAVLTGGASLPTSLARFGAKTALKNVDNLAVGLAKEAVENTATKAVKNTFSESGVKALRNLNRNTAIGEAVGEGLKTVSFAARSSMFEAGMEARHNFRDNVDNFINKYQEEKGELPSYDVLKSYIDDANTTANAVFAGNMAVLSLSNVAMFGKMFGLKPQFTGISKAWNKSLGLGVDTLADGTKVLGKANVFQKALGYSAPVIGKAFTEGVFEEGTQGIFGKAMTSYLDGKYLNNNATMTYFDALAEGAKEQYGTSDGIHEMIMGGLIGLIGGNASAVVAKTGVLGQETKKNSQFGIAGFFQDSYGAKRKRTQSEIENYNKSIAPFRASTRLNSVGSMFSNENIDDFGLAEDTVNNYNFIKTSEQYKDFTDTVADFNTMVDSHQFDPQQLKQMNLSEEQVAEYKQGLKDKFLKDYESYTKASKIVDRLDLTGGNLTNGNLNELKDAVSFSLMFADKAGQDAQKVSENISQLVGEGGIYDALKFFQGVDEENIKLLDEIKQKQEEKQKLTELIVELGEDSETNESKMKDLSKQRESATNRILKLETEIKNLNDILSNKAQTLGQQASAKQEATTNIQTLINQYNSINNYMDSLEKTGKTKDASDLKFLISQFKALNAIDASSQQTIRRMLDTNFFEGEGKGFIAKVLGNTYNPSEQFLEDLRANEQVIAPLLEAFGITEKHVGIGVVKMMKDNTELSDKEKYLLESVVRTLEARKRVIKYVSEVKDTEAQDRTPQVETRGDRLSRVRIPENITTIEQLNNIIKTISNEIDILTNQPTREALKQIKSLEKQLADARQRLLDLQNGKIITENAIQEQETTSVLQREQEEVGETGSERRGVEQVNEGQETSQEISEEKIADISIGKIPNTNYEVKSDGVYYEGKKIDNPKNLSLKELIEEDIERRRFEEILNFLSENDKQTVLKIPEVSERNNWIKTKTKDTSNTDIVKPSNKGITEDSKFNVQYYIGGHKSTGEMMPRNISEYANKNQIAELIGYNKAVVRHEGIDYLIVSNNQPRTGLFTIYIEIGENFDIDSLSDNFIDEVLKFAENSYLDYESLGKEVLKKIVKEVSENSSNGDKLSNVNIINIINVKYDAELAELNSQETLNESKEKVIENHAEQIVTENPNIIEESTEEEIEEAYNEAIQDNFLEKAVETLRNDLEDLRNSEAPNQELIEEIEQQIEQYEREINGENIRVNDGEAPSPISEGDTEASEGTTIQSSPQNDSSARIQETQEEINRLENEINELKTPFKFLDSDSYKEYRKLLNKKMTPNSGYSVEDDLRLTELENSIDKWITILGTEVEGVELSDLIKQLVTLENIEVNEGSNIEEVSDEEMEADIKTANVSTDNNFNTGINTKLVVGRSIRRDGNIFTIISNITLDKFKQLSGVEITEDDVLILPDTRGITISQSLVDKINEQGNIVILQNNAGETGTYSSPLLIKTVDLKGNEEYSMLETDFEENIDDDKASEVKAGDSLNLAIDTSVEYNKEYLDKVKVLQEDTITEENLEEEVSKQTKIDLVNDKKIQELQNKIRLIDNSTFISTTKKAERNKLQTKLNERMNEVEDLARIKVEKKLSTQKLNITKELRQELADNLRISVIDKEGVNVQTLKGTRRNQSSKVEADKSSLEALRTRIVEDDIFLMSLLSQEDTMVPIEGLTIKVDHVYPGLPNFNYSSDASSKVYKPIEKQNTQNIVDIGYIQGGRALTRNNTEFDKTLIKTSMNRKNSTKTPFIVVKRGSTNVAVPVRVGREEGTVDLDLFSNVFNADNMTASEKANKLNSMLAQGGIDVSQPENAFIALGDNLSQEKFNELFGKLSEKEYLRSVDNWIDKSVSIQTALEQAEASTNINLSQPFKGTKIRFNLDEYKPESSNSEEVKNSEVVKEYINSENVGLRRFKNKC